MLAEYISPSASLTKQTESLFVHFTKGRMVSISDATKKAFAHGYLHLTSSWAGDEENDNHCPF